MPATLSDALKYVGREERGNGVVSAGSAVAGVSAWVSFDYRTRRIYYLSNPILGLERMDHGHVLLLHLLADVLGHSMVYMVVVVDSVVAVIKMPRQIMGAIDRIVFFLFCWGFVFVLERTTGETFSHLVIFRGNPNKS